MWRIINTAYDNVYFWIKMDLTVTTPLKQKKNWKRVWKFTAYPLAYTESNPQNQTGKEKKNRTPSLQNT